MKPGFVKKTGWSEQGLRKVPPLAKSMDTKQWISHPVVVQVFLFIFYSVITLQNLFI